MARRKKDLEESRRLHDWAEERLFHDQYSSFLNYCQSIEDKMPYEMIPESEFLALKERFELGY